MDAAILNDASEAVSRATRISQAGVNHNLTRLPPRAFGTSAERQSKGKRKKDLRTARELARERKGNCCRKAKGRPEEGSRDAERQVEGRKAGRRQVERQVERKR